MMDLSVIGQRFRHLSWRLRLLVFSALLALGVCVFLVLWHIFQSQGYREAETIYMAAAHGDCDKLRRLLREKPELVNARTEIGNTPLFSAVYSLEVFKLLIKEGADINIKNKLGETLLHEVAKGGNADIVEILLSYGLEVDAKNKRGETPLIMAAKHENSNAFPVFIAHGSAINARDHVNATPLYYAVRLCDIDSIKYLVSKGADINAKALNGVTPLHVAMSSGNEKIAEFLIEKGADVNVITSDGNTPLHLAINSFASLTKSLDKPAKTAFELGFIQMIDGLLSRGADVNIENKAGKTSLELAKDAGFVDIVNFLSEHGAKE